MAKRIDVEDVNVFYGDFLAVQDASINIAPLSVPRSSARPAAASRPSCGC